MDSMWESGTWWASEVDKDQIMEELVAKYGIACLYQRAMGNCWKVLSRRVRILFCNYHSNCFDGTDFENMLE